MKKLEIHPELISWNGSLASMDEDQLQDIFFAKAVSENILRETVPLDISVSDHNGRPVLVFSFTAPTTVSDFVAALEIYVESLHIDIDARNISTTFHLNTGKQIKYVFVRNVNSAALISKLKGGIKHVTGGIINGQVVYPWVEWIKATSISTAFSD